MQNDSPPSAPHFQQSSVENGETRKKGKTMSIKTNLVLDSWLSEIYWGITSSVVDIRIADGVHAIVDQPLAETDASMSVQKILATSDKRKPAYVQLRNAWDTLDGASQKKSVGWILQKTMIDPLSGLETLVAKELSGQRPAGWVEAISDLNSLKVINDTWGHKAGDQVIRELGKIVKTEVDKEGGRAFRVGGDEISYWFSDTKAAKRALGAIDARFQTEAFVIGGRKCKGFSMSYGIGPDAISADNALYLDKERRKKLGQRANHGQMPESIDIQLLTTTLSGGFLA
jgi:diguanylate cyclase (GGDEF)-like protein